MAAHEARSAFARNHAQKMLDLVIADESAFIPRSPIGGAEGAARLEVRDAKAVILPSQAIPESAGYVHKAFGIEV
jgi:hypothetical protein